MDGVEERLSASVQRQLSLGLSLAIAVVALLAGVLSFAAAYGEAQELQDDILRQVAQLIDAHALGPPAAPADEHFKDHDDASRLIVQRLGQAGPAGLPVDDGGALPLPATLAYGLHTLELDGESFRVLVKTARSGERFAVAQEADLRDELARDSALRTLLPFAVLVPMLLLVVAALVRGLFRPIVALAGEIDRRSEQRLQPIGAARVPSEVRPFVVDRLFARVQQAIDAQRRFGADAAHELRSPLAALPVSGTSIIGVVRRVLEDLMPLAEARRIDIGVEGAPHRHDAQQRIGAPELSALVRNLVDNAIRHTLEGGRSRLEFTDPARGTGLCVSGKRHARGAPG